MSLDSLSSLVRIPAGRYRIGSDRFYPEEAPSREIDLPAFQIERSPVTNREFAHFVRSSGYRTISERPADPQVYPLLTPEQRQPASIVFQAPPSAVDRSQPRQWWALVPGASWQHPQGPGSSIADLDDHPVVHIAYADAIAYCTWANRRLPTAEEWEVAARGGLKDADYAWGEDVNPNGRWMANTWQGEFPWQNDVLDGWEWTSPVGAFPANGYGLMDVCGNVWEWTSSAYPTPKAEQQRHIVKGGSFLCADNYCKRYRPSALIGQTLDTSTCHMGFRCALDAAD